MNILSVLEVNRKETARELKNEMGVWRGWNESLAPACWIAQIVTIEI